MAPLLAGLVLMLVQQQTVQRFPIPSGHGHAWIPLLGTGLWPILLSVAIGRSEPLTSSCNRRLWIPYAWPFLVGMADILLLHTGVSQGPLRFEPTSVTALAFGLCGVLGGRNDSQFIHLFLLAVLGCVLGVMPHVDYKDKESHGAKTVRILQRTMLVWCIGFMVAGVLLMHRLCLAKLTA